MTYKSWAADLLFSMKAREAECCLEDVHFSVSSVFDAGTDAEVLSSYSIHLSIPGTS